MNVYSEVKTTEQKAEYNCDPENLACPFNNFPPKAHHYPDF